MKKKTAKVASKDGEDELEDSLDGGLTDTSTPPNAFTHRASFD